MKKILILLTILSVSFLNAQTCYELDRTKTFNLFKKAFKKSDITINNLYWNGPQVSNPNGYSIMMNFDGKLKRGIIWYDKKCNPISLKVSEGKGTVTIYYYNVINKNVKLLKTRKNTY